MHGLVLVCHFGLLTSTSTAISLDPGLDEVHAKFSERPDRSSRMLTISCFTVVYNEHVLSKFDLWPSHMGSRLPKRPPDR